MLALYHLHMLLIYDRITYEKDKKDLIREIVYRCLIINDFINNGIFVHYLLLQSSPYCYQFNGVKYQNRRSPFAGYGGIHNKRT